MLTVLTPPVAEPVSLDEARDFLRIGHDGEDDLVLALISAARAHLEAASGLALVSRVFRMTGTSWPERLTADGLALRPRPVTALLGVRTMQADGMVEDVSARFVLAAERLCLRPWSAIPLLPEGARFEVDFEAGFGPPEQTPEDLKLAVKQLIASAYRSRNADVTPLPDSISTLIAPYREVRL